MTLIRDPREHVSGADALHPDCTYGGTEGAPCRSRETIITNPDLLVQHAKDVLAKWDSPEFDKPDTGTMAVHIGQLRANVRMMAEFIEAHAGTCPIRTGSAL